MSYHLSSDHFLPGEFSDADEDQRPATSQQPPMHGELPYRPLGRGETAAPGPSLVSGTNNLNYSDNANGVGSGSEHEDDEVYDTDSEYAPEEMEPLAHPSTWEHEIRQHHDHRHAAENHHSASPPTQPQAADASRSQPQQQAQDSAAHDDEEFYSEEVEDDFSDDEPRAFSTMNTGPSHTPGRRVPTHRRRTSPAGNVVQAPSMPLPSSPGEVYQPHWTPDHRPADQSAQNEGGNLIDPTSLGTASSAIVTSEDFTPGEIVQAGDTRSPHEHVPSTVQGPTGGQGLASAFSDSNNNSMPRIDRTMDSSNEETGSQLLSATSAPQADRMSDVTTGVQAVSDMPAPVPASAPRWPEVETTPNTGSPVPFRLSGSTPRLTPSTPPPPEVVLPRWQPDAEVTICPICGTQFSFFVRKHHCRKCGRVVCNSCSPHRITIPYQFIVQPPNEPSSPRAASRSQFAAGIHSSPASNVTNLGGGERVRLCNPCVPDPNTAPPRSPLGDDHPLAAPSFIRTHTRSSSLADSQLGILARLPADDAEDRLHSNRTRALRSPPPQLVSGTLSDFYASQRAQTPDRRSTVSFSSPRRMSRGEYGVPDAQASPLAGASLAHGQRFQSRYRDADMRRYGFRGQVHSTEAQPAAQGDDGDFCPVCHVRMPTHSIDPVALERLREAHVRECIDAAIRGSSSTPPVPVIPSLAPPRSGGPSSSLPSSSFHPAASSSSSTPGARFPEPFRFASSSTGPATPAPGMAATSAYPPPAPTPRRTGIFPYRATEKDGVDSAECTICFEEFEVGVEMARLECFCRFHHACIMRWFETRPGQCPVHQHGNNGY